MFLFNSLHTGSRKASRSLASKNPASGSSDYLHNKRSGVFAMFFMFCLSTALLFTGCETEPEELAKPNTGFIPVGEWTSQWDGYSISNTSVEYGELKGTIEKAIDFSGNAGVLIIKITASSGDFTVNKYTGVYYSEYTPASIKLANVWLEGSNGDWYPLETDTLSEAVSLFSVDNVGDHVSYWGVYIKE